MVPASPRIYRADKFQGMLLAVTLFWLYYWGNISEKKSHQQSSFSFLQQLPSACTHLYLSPTTIACTLTCSFPEQKLVWLVFFARVPPTCRLEDPSWHVQSAPKTSALCVSAQLTPSCCCIPCLHQMPLGDNCFHLLTPWERCSFQPLLQAETLLSSWLPAAVTVHLSTVWGWHCMERGRKGSPCQVTTHLGCLGFFLCCWFSFKMCLSPACCLNGSKANVSFFTRLPKRDHSWKEDGRKKQRLHGIFLTRLLHLHLSSAVLEATEQERSSWLSSRVVPNSQLFASVP